MTGHSRSKRELLGVLVLFLAAFALLYCGWRLFWFLTDDAFIAFRYVSNSILGHRYVWNPPPFRPVEGYTSPLWVVLLDLIWRTTGIEPPGAANWVSLAFACLTLIVGGLMILRMDLTGPLRRYRILLLGLVLLGVISNRTFLAWSSSGLETAMFNCAFTLWVYACLFLRPDRRTWILGVASTAAFVYLARPDGMLVVLVSAALIALALYHRKRSSELRTADLAACLPLLIVPAHLALRLKMYGEWLPNSSYAKLITGWIKVESGWRYLLSFVIEYSLWIWLGALAVLLVLKLRAFRPRSTGRLLRPGFSSIVQITVVLTVLAHFLYYTFLIGGDHFEFRVYSHLILLIFLSFIYILNAMRAGARLAAALLVLFIVLSWPVPWTHWAASQAFTTRKDTFYLKVSVAEAAQEWPIKPPKPVLDYLRAYDEMQFWLIGHTTCMRHQEHKILHLYLVETLPARDQDKGISVAHHPVQAYPVVGVISWVYPEVNFIDTHGLNDYVIARNPDINRGFMAHERKPPPGYLECFSPDLPLGGIVDVTTERIIQCEQDYAGWVLSLRGLTP